MKKLLFNFSQVEVEVVLHNLELLGVDLDQAWVVEAENTGRVMMMLQNGLSLCHLLSYRA